MSHLIAVAQMTSSLDIEENYQQCFAHVKKAAALGASIVCLPENFAFMGAGDGDNLKMAQSLDGPLIERFRSLALKNKLWLSLGGFQEKLTDSAKIANTHLIINSQGEIVELYRKIHLFSVQIPDGVNYNEALTVQAGDKAVVCESPFGVLGLSICYDLRFSSLFLALKAKKAQILLIPAAFTAYTGKDHWEILLRARAIETQCYVIAAAQVGTHNGVRKTHGHAMIIDPWGLILAQCSPAQSLALAEIDLDYLDLLRGQMPIASHYRSFS